MEVGREKMKIDIPDELIEKLSAEDPEGYVRRVLEDHVAMFEGVTEATSKDAYLMHVFIGQLENPEEIMRAVGEQSRAEGRQLGRDEVFTSLWTKLGPENRLTWASFVEKWQSPLYGDKSFGELAKALMQTKTVVEFCERTGLSYGKASKNIIPKLIAAGIPRMIVQLFDYRYLGWSHGKPSKWDDTMPRS